MKLKISHLFLVVFIAFFSACSSDDEPKSNLTQGELAEGTPITKEKVFDNIIVEGATKKIGAPTVSNEEMSFTLNKENTSAVMIDGFDIEFSSNDNIVGAYLQIKDTEGNLADGYYDIDLSKVSDKKKEVERKNSTHSIDQLFRQTEQKNAKASTNKAVDIDFKAAIEPGIFCYLVAVYDADGNTSPPQEVCVTVQSWGGNDDLVGNWNFTKTEGLDNINVGIESCHIIDLEIDSLQNCPTLSTVYNKCFTLDSITYNINIDGTYKYKKYSTDKSLDWRLSLNTCEIIDKKRKDHTISSGNWAYNQNKNELIIVETESTGIVYGNGIGYGTGNTEFYDKGEAKTTVFKADISGNSSDLILTDDADALNIYQHFFDKE